MKTFVPIVKAVDRDIDCPLFRKLQEFFVKECECSALVAVTRARLFMRETWLSDDRLMTRKPSE